MKPFLQFIAIVTCLCLCSCDKDNNSPNDPIPKDIEFKAASYSFANAERPYQRGEINIQEGVTPAVIIYLHGGSSKGTDNSKQMEEPAIQIIAEHVRAKGISAVFIVPQCPEKDSQGKRMDWVKMAKALEFLVNAEKRSSDASVYILGGSMGGTGTWNMLSSYPDLFTAGMACAGNPKGCIPANVAKTPVFAVMGSADKIMKPEEVNLQAFLDDVEASGGMYKFDTEIGWDHEKTCKESYTSERLNWVFSHR